NADHADRRFRRVSDPISLRNSLSCDRGYQPIRVPPAAVIHFVATPEATEQFSESARPRSHLRSVLSWWCRRSGDRPVRQCDELFGDSDESETLSPQQIVERWKPILESLDRLFGDAREEAAGTTPV